MAYIRTRVTDIFRKTPLNIDYREFKISCFITESFRVDGKVTKKERHLCTFFGRDNRRINPDKCPLKYFDEVWYKTGWYSSIEQFWQLNKLIPVEERIERAGISREKLYNQIRERIVNFMETFDKDLERSEKSRKEFRKFLSIHGGLG